MNAPRELPDELVWEGEHLAEVALTALADGQDDVVPLRAREHVVHCVACTHAVGAAALLSSHVGASLAEAAPARQSSPVRQPIPVGGVLVALALAALGALPALSRAPGEIGEAAAFFVRTAPQILRGGLAVLKTSQGLGPLVSVLASVALVLTGLAVARSMPRPVAA